MAESKLNDIIKTSFESIKEIVDCNTVMGDPISTPQGTTIIPVSKVAVGYASGGLDYFGKNLPAPERNAAEKIGSFGGGGGTGITVTPLGFIVIRSNGTVELLSIAAANNEPTIVTIIDTVVDLAERSPEIIAKLKGIFSKEGKEPKKEEINITINNDPQDKQNTK